MRLEFYDNAAPDNYTLLVPDVAVLCYDVSERQSLESVKLNWRKKVILHFRREDRIPVILLGLKRDLRDKMVAEGLKGWIDPHEVSQTICLYLRVQDYLERNAMQLFEHRADQIITGL